MIDECGVYLQYIRHLQLNIVLSMHVKTLPSILAVHVVEDAGGLLPVVVVVDGDQGVPGLLDSHNVPQGDVDAGLLCGHLVKIQHYLQRDK